MHLPQLSECTNTTAVNTKQVFNNQPDDHCPINVIPKPNRVVLTPKSNQTANVNHSLTGINTNIPTKGTWLRWASKLLEILKCVDMTRQMFSHYSNISTWDHVGFFSGVSSCFSSLCVSCVSCLSLCLRCGRGNPSRLSRVPADHAHLPNSPTCCLSTHQPSGAPSPALHPPGARSFFKSSVVSTAVYALHLMWNTLWTVTDVSYILKWRVKKENSRSKETMHQESKNYHMIVARINLSEVLFTLH